MPKIAGLLIVLAVVQIALQISALRNLYRQPRVTGNNKWIWVAIILLGGMLGPLVYYAAGRKEQ